MIWTIARREFLEYLKSLRFLTGFLVTIALVALSTVINVSDYAERLSDYSTARKEMAGDAYPLVLFRPPEVLSTLVQGLDRTLGSRASLTVRDNPTRASGYMETYAVEHHRFVSGFSTVDFAFLVRIIMSLLVIFLAYNTVAGEKSAGTLRLTLSHAVPRYALLLGKSAGGLALVLATLCASLAVALLILVTNPAIALTGSDWLRIAGIALMSALYLVVIFALSVFVSVLVDRPSVSLLILLQAWIFFVVLYPAGAITVAGEWIRLPGEEELAERKKAAFQPFEKEDDQVRKAFSDSLKQTAHVPMDIDLHAHELDVRRATLNHGIDVELAGKENEQVRLAAILGMCSPAALFDYAVVRLARTGGDEYDRFIQSVGRVWAGLEAFQRSRISNPENRRRAFAPDFNPLCESSAESFVATLPEFIGMLVLLLIPFVAANAKFNGKDVR
jgi:ABC-type transport system involved in multi-copper enzyme maturation permease subunit